MHLSVAYRREFPALRKCFCQCLRLGSLAAAFACTLALPAWAQTTLHDQLILTADLTATGDSHLDIGGEHYQDALTISGHGMVTLERDLVTPSLWHTVATNFVLNLNGGGIESNLGGTTTWTYIPGVPDFFKVELDTSDFPRGLLYFKAYDPEVWVMPANQNETYDARFWLLSNWNDYNNDQTAGILHVPTNGLPFTVSATEQRQDTFPDPPVSYTSDKGTLNVTYTVSYQPKDHHLAITSVQTPATAGTTHTFISTDTITVQATITPALPDTSVGWVVLGKNAAAGPVAIAGVSRTDASGVASFTFQLAQSQSFVMYRHGHFTSGSRTPNDPIILDVKASAAGMDAMLSQTTLGPLEQDETDTMRQEYVDFQILVPPRGDVQASLGPGYNVGNYGVQLSVDLPGSYQRILSGYRGSAITVNNVATVMPASAGISIASGFRNPRRNLAAGSAHPNSRHVYGRALDLVPDPVAVVINGQRVQVGLHPVLYPALYQACLPEGTTIAEKNGVDVVTPGDPSENHIHVQW